MNRKRRKSIFDDEEDDVDFLEEFSMFDENEFKRFHKRKRDELSSNVDVFDLGDNYEVIIDIPGLKDENLNIMLKGNNLILEVRSGYNILVKRVKLPSNVGTKIIKKSLKHGVLDLILPKK